MSGELLLLIPSTTGVEGNVLDYLSPGKVMFVAILVAGAWVLL